MSAVEYKIFFISLKYMLIGLHFKHFQQFYLKIRVFYFNFTRTPVTDFAVLVYLCTYIHNDDIVKVET